MMEVAEKLIEDRFKNQWAAKSMTVPLGWNNVPFRQPDNGEWVRLVVRCGSTTPTSVGLKVREEMIGQVIVQVFVPKASGSRRSAEIADIAVSCLRYTQMKEDGVVVSLSGGGISGEAETTTHYQKNAVINFRVNSTTEGVRVV